MTLQLADEMSVIITSELLPLLSSLLKNLWNWVFGVSHSFQFSRKSSEILWVWMAVIYATQPVHCVKLNCLFFTDSMEAWWLCRLLFIYFFKEDRLQIEFCHSGRQLHSKDCMRCLGRHAWQRVPGLPKRHTSRHLPIHCQPLTT